MIRVPRMLLIVSLALTFGERTLRSEEPAKSQRTDQALVEQLSQKLTSQMEAPLSKLNALARTLSREVRANLQFGRELARLETREELLQQAIEQNEEQKKLLVASRRRLVREYEQEVETLRSLFSSDPALRDRELLRLIQAYRPPLDSLKVNEDKLQAFNDIAKERLTTIRLHRQALHRRMQMAKHGLGEPLPPIAGWDDGLFDDETSARTSSEPSPTETLKEAQKSIADLLK